MLNLFQYNKNYEKVTGEVETDLMYYQKSGSNKQLK